MDMDKVYNPPVFASLHFHNNLGDISHRIALQCCVGRPDRSRSSGHTRSSVHYNHRNGSLEDIWFGSQLFAFHTHRDTPNKIQKMGFDDVLTQKLWSEKSKSEEKWIEQWTWQTSQEDPRYPIGQEHFSTRIACSREELLELTPVSNSRLRREDSFMIWWWSYVARMWTCSSEDRTNKISSRVVRSVIGTSPLNWASDLCHSPSQKRTSCEVSTNGWTGVRNTWYKVSPFPEIMTSANFSWGYVTPDDGGGEGDDWLKEEPWSRSTRYLIANLT